MKKSEILDISEISDKEIQVSYKILNKHKGVIYKKNSQKLIKCFDEYLELLNERKQNLANKNDNKIFIKKVSLYILTLIITIILVYFLLINCLGGNLILNIIGYLGSLLLIVFSFLIVHLITYKNDLLLENEYLKITKEILEIQLLRNQCLEINKKNK